MREIIKIEPRQVGAETTQTVNLRELHKFLESKRQFGNWAKDKLAEAMAVEGTDFTVNKFVIGKSTHIDYHVTLDTAKSIGMLERNEKGRQIRSYFIDAEKALVSNALPARVAALEAQLALLIQPRTRKPLRKLPPRPNGRPRIFTPEALLAMVSGEVTSSELMLTALNAGWKIATFWRTLRQLKASGHLRQTTPGKWRRC